MSGLIQIQWTTGSIDEARRVSRYLVQERLVACANIVPWVESIYMWNNELKTGQESKVFFKTTEAHWTAVRDVILDNTNYEVPEILKVSLDGGNEAYVAWVEESASATV